MRITAWSGLRSCVMSEIRCDICFRHCILQEGQTGFCRARANHSGRNISVNRGKITGLALDPIEKKPLAMFYPGSWILSAGSFGCNFACPFCQNWHISMADEDSAGYEELSAQTLADLIKERRDSIGIAFTYNEPLIEWEYILDVAKLVKPAGKKVVLVSNGCAEQWVLETLAPYIDAMNIDLKGDAAFYRELQGSYAQVKHTIEYMHDKCHLEITSLIIPGKNDSREWVSSEAEWLASLDPEIPLHLTRYFPRWKYTVPATPVQTILDLKQTAQQHLRHVFAGNI